MPTAAQLIANIGTRINDTSTAQQTKMVKALNWAQRWIWNKRRWSWKARTIGGIYTKVPIDLTAVTVTSGSGTVTCSTSNSDASVSTDITAGIYPFIVFGSNTDQFYRISARTYSAPTSTLTITPYFTGDTSSTDTATIYFREYALPSDVAGLEVISNGLGQRLIAVNISDHWYLDPKPTQTTGRPRYYATRAKAVPSVILEPIPDDNYPLPLEYVPNLVEVTSTSAEADFAVPPRWHHFLEEAALWYLRNIKDDTREKSNEALSREMLSEMIIDDVTMGGNRLPMVKREGTDQVSERDFTSDLGGTRRYR